MQCIVYWGPNVQIRGRGFHLAPALTGGYLSLAFLKKYMPSVLKMMPRSD